MDNYNYTWHAVEERDIEGLEALNAACLLADGPASVNGLAYRDLLATPEITMLCATGPEGEGQIAAAGWVQAGGERAWLWGKVHPQHRRRRFE